MSAAYMWLPHVIHGPEDLGVSPLAAAKTGQCLFGVIFTLIHRMIKLVILCDPPLEKAHLQRQKKSSQLDYFQNIPILSSIYSQR